LGVVMSRRAPGSAAVAIPPVQIKAAISSRDAESQEELRARIGVFLDEIVKI
jgi:hypothetical protein